MVARIYATTPIRGGEALRDLAASFVAGKLKSREHIIDGLKNLPEALLMLFRGENHGKSS